MSIYRNHLPLMGASTGGDYEIGFSGQWQRSQADHMKRSFDSGGNRKKYTVSVWLKLGAMDGASGQQIFTQRSSFSSATNQLDNFQIGEDNAMAIQKTNGAGANVFSKNFAAFVHGTAWIHHLIAIDTTQSDIANAGKYYRDGVQITSTTYTNYNGGTNYEGLHNSAAEHRIGMYFTNYHYNGYMADFYFIDDQALTPSDFTDGTGDDILPIEYSGAYGETSFFLNFSNGSDLGEDFSGEDNDFTNVGVTQSTDTPSNPA